METEVKTTAFPENVTLENVYSAYNGKIGCMCGCNGDYAYASKHKEFASSNRGYGVSEDEISDSKVKRRFNAMHKIEGEFIVGYNYVYVERGERCFAVYFKK